MTDTPAADDERPDNACTLHRPPRDGWPWRIADPSYRTCGPCLDKLRQQLTEVRDRYHLLDPTPGNTGDGTRGAPGFGSKPPASVHVISMTDPRSSQTARMWQAADGKLHAEDERPPVSVRSVLDTLCWDVAEQLDVEGPDTRLDVDGLTRWIDVRLDAITRHTDTVLETSRIVRLLLAALRPVTGEPRGRRIGRCPQIVDTAPDLGWAPAYTHDPGVPVLCGDALYAPPKGDTIRCRACGHAWPRDEWLQLGAALQGTAA